MKKHGVRVLLMGGQACVLYGGAEFSRDTDLALLPDAVNLDRLGRALDELSAKPIAVPELSKEWLDRGHAVHFRCQHPEAPGMRIDLMSVMRGVAPFEELWGRRTTVELPDGESYDLLALPDLVRAKKTQRDKDWPMIRRLVEASYFRDRESPTAERVEFWLRELRTPSLIVQVAADHSEVARSLIGDRPLLESALAGGESEIEEGLEAEETRERALDREYWAPLREELAELRRRRRRDG